MPTKDSAKIWRDVERELGHRVSKAARDYLEESREAELSYLEFEQAVEELADEVRRLGGHGFAVTPSPGSASIEIPDGARWQLLYDLGRRFEAKFADHPLTDEFHGFAPMNLEHYHDSSSYPPSERVKVEFDSGMNLATVTALLQREFRERYRPKGWVRTTRPLGERAIALVRFVCLEAEEGLTWRRRLARWNERFPEWRFKDARRLASAFRRAEMQLTGIRGSLTTLYITRQEWEHRDEERRAREIARIEHYYEMVAAFPDADKDDLEVALAESPDAEASEIADLLRAMEEERRELAQLWGEQP